MIICYLTSSNWAHHRDHTAGPDAVAHSKHRHVISILSPLKEILISHVVGMIIHHPASTLHSARVTTVHVGGKISRVAHALIRATLEVPVLVEDDLKNQLLFYCFIFISIKLNPCQLNLMENCCWNEVYLARHGCAGWFSVVPQGRSWSWFCLLAHCCHRCFYTRSRLKSTPCLLSVNSWLCKFK